MQSEHSEQEFNTWIRPLQAEVTNDSIILYAPNHFVVDWIKQNFYSRMISLIKEFSSEENPPTLILKVGSKKNIQKDISDGNKVETNKTDYSKKLTDLKYSSYLNKEFTFQNFVKGKSNEFAFAAASQVAKRPGEAYNPLLIYGGVGLGKTHLMCAIGNEFLINHPGSKILYLHSERFVANMVKSLQTNTIDEFKDYHRSVNFLLIDDIQFFSGKDRSQEEFFHVFNTLLEERKQIVLTCDRYPKEIEGLKERLKSRFGWGLTVAVEPPELETRVAIIMNKAEHAHVALSSEVAFFIAEKIRSNVRELEGALKRVIATSEFTGKPITVDFVKDALRDLINIQDKLVTIENIQKVAAEYFKLKISDLMSKRRNRSVVRPRQIAMALAKELTNKSLPEIGDAFGGRDHTTVIHACRKIKELLDIDIDVKEDYSNLLRLLTA